MKKPSQIERKKISFIRKLLRNKTAYKISDKRYRFTLSNHLIALSHTHISELVSDGIIDFKEDKISINSQSRNWLLRKMALGDEQFSEQHRNIKTQENGRRINLNESPISRLTIVTSGKKPYLDNHHVEAALRFSKLMERACLRSSITMNYNDGQLASSKYGASSKMDISDMAIDARKEIEKLLSNLPADCAAIIIDVCGFEKGLQLAEIERGWPRRSAKLILRIGLEQLAQNFGLSQKIVKKNTGSFTSWLDNGARPNIFG